MHGSCTGLVLAAVPESELHDYALALANRIASVPLNQLHMQKLVINEAVLVCHAHAT